MKFYKRSEEEIKKILIMELIDYTLKNKMNKDLILNIMINDVDYTITVYDSNNDNDLVNINEIKLEWPNYMRVIPKMVDIVLDNKLKHIFDELLKKYDGDKDEMFVDFKEIINRFIELNIINIEE